MPGAVEGLAVIYYHPALLGSITTSIKTLVKILVPRLLLIPTATWDKLPHFSMTGWGGDTGFPLSPAWIQGWQRQLHKGLCLPVGSACPV